MLSWCLFSPTFYTCVVVLLAAFSIVLRPKTNGHDCDFGDGYGEDTLRPCQGKSSSDVGDHGNRHSCNGLHDGVGPSLAARASSSGAHIEAREVTKKVCSDEMVSNRWDYEEEEGDTIDAKWKAMTRGGKNGHARGREEPGETGAPVPQQSVTKEILIQTQMQDIAKRAHETSFEYWYNKGEENNTVEAAELWIEDKPRSKSKKALRKCKTCLVYMPESSAGMEDHKVLRKVETFNDKGSIECTEELDRDPSAGLEEFNKKVQDFIDNMNKELRLQRQKSDGSDGK